MPPGDEKRSHLVRRSWRDARIVQRWDPAAIRRQGCCASAWVHFGCTVQHRQSRLASAGNARRGAARPLWPGTRGRAGRAGSRSRSGTRPRVQAADLRTPASA